MSHDDSPHATTIRLIAHELRNPLTAIQLNAQLIERSAGRDGREQERRWATLITGAARRLDDMVRQLVEAERLRSGQLELARAAVAWDEVWREIAARPGTDDPSTQQVHLVAPATAVMVEADRARLSRVMGDLLQLTSLASDATASLTVELSLKEGLARCSIRAPAPPDAGDGLAAATGGCVQLEAGPGIVLHFARALIEALGGKLRVDQGDPRLVGFEVELRAVT